MIKTDTLFSKTDESLPFSLDADFFLGFQDGQVVGYLNPDSYLPTPIIVLYVEGDNIILRWPTGYEECFAKDQNALRFFEARQKDKYSKFFLEENKIILEEVKNINIDVPRQFKYDQSTDVQVAWCDPNGTVYIGNHNEMISSYKEYLQDKKVNASTKEMIRKFLDSENTSNK